MAADTRPNIVVILADDMGFSDIAPFGSEIATPNLSRLSQSGVRFTQFYNCARCCPTRASLLTGQDPHVAGIGHMVKDNGHPGYRGFLGEDVATIPEVLRPAGYATLMSGKWHVGGDYHPLNEEQWRVAGTPGHPTPRQRGFDRFYGILTGAGSFFRPPTLMRDDEFIDTESPQFHFTDAIGDEAARMIRECPVDKPFFLYLAHTAPHWPLHARAEDMARYEGRYQNGWDALRTSRHEELKGIGILDSRWEISPRDPDSHPWETDANRDWEDLRMAAYAAQVEQMDRSIGTVLSEIEARGQMDSTLIMFLSDNGGCAEFLREDGQPASWPGWYARQTIDGRAVTVGNTPTLRPGDDTTFMSYDLPWANASNAPFRMFKHWVHEGGIATPLIAHWPDRFGSGISHAPYHVKDILSTCLDAAGVSTPGEIDGREVLKPSGESFLDEARNAGGRQGIFTRSQPILWEHEGNRAVRDGEWKLVSRHPGEWELYNMTDDRTELHDLSAGEADRLRSMVRTYERWADTSRVLPWPLS